MVSVAVTVFENSVNDAVYTLIPFKLVFIVLSHVISTTLISPPSYLALAVVGNEKLEP